MKFKLPVFISMFILGTMLFLSSEVKSATFTINVMNFAFSPANISVSVGDTIKWQYVSGNHTTTNNGSFGTSRPAGAPSWDAPINVGMLQYKYVVTVPGSYTYKCLFHSSMIGNFTATSPVINLNLSSIIEGFWNGATMVSDTVNVTLNKSAPPYEILDSAKVKLSSSGTGALTFSNAPGGSYFIVVKHRNSIETWSKLPVVFTSGGTENYDFTSAANKAFGDNLVFKDGKYTFYSGDVNQDESINLTDVIQIYNEATYFSAGYVVTDVNGDNITDLTDVLIAQNNANNFVSVVKP